MEQENINLVASLTDKKYSRKQIIEALAKTN